MKVMTSKRCFMGLSRPVVKIVFTYMCSLAVLLAPYLTQVATLHSKCTTILSWVQILMVFMY